MFRRLKGFLIVLSSMLLFQQEGTLVARAQQTPITMVVMTTGCSFLLPTTRTSRNRNDSSRPGQKKLTYLRSSSFSSLLDANKPVKKLWLKLQEWKTRGRGPNGKQANRLLIDANNVRGISSFRWSPVDLLRYVANFATEEDLQEQIIVVLDHGNQKYATMVYNESIAIVFAGLTQTADDVIVSCALETNYDSSSLAVVTNDVGLRRRLRSVTQQQKGYTNMVVDAARIFEIDSTRFVDLLLLHQNHTNSDPTKNLKSVPLFHNGQEDSLERIVQTTQDQIQAFYSHQRSSSIMKKGGGHSINQRNNVAFRKREQPWERVVIAEAMRLALFETNTKKYSSVSRLHDYVIEWNCFHGVHERKEDANDNKNIAMMNGTCSNETDKNQLDPRDIKSTLSDEHLPSISIPLRWDKANQEMLQKYQRWAYQRSREVDPKRMASRQDGPDQETLPPSLRLSPWSKRAARRQRQE